MDVFSPWSHQSFDPGAFRSLVMFESSPERPFTYYNGVAGRILKKQMKMEMEVIHVKEKPGRSTFAKC